MAFKPWLLGILDAALGQPVKEEAFREAYGEAIDPDEDQWRKLTGDAQRDLTPMNQARMQKVAHYLWESNLLGNRLIELPMAYLLAEGAKLKVKDEENQKVLDRFWADPINEMDVKLAKKVRELAIFGEQCYPTFVNDQSGAVRIGYLDPALIETVVMDPDNSEQAIGIVTCKDRKGNARRYRVVINGDEDVFTSRTQKIRESFADGDAFFFRVNDLSSGTRGRSDLLAQADWLDAYDQFMFGELERYAYLRAFVWDVSLKNATEEQVKDRASKIAMPKSGGVYVHNDSEILEPKTPEFQASDAANGARLFRNHVLGGATIPEHWFGGGGDVNRAVGAEMSEPTFKIYTMRQRTLKYMLESIGRYVLLKASKGVIDFAEEKNKVEAIFPELAAKDTTKYASAIQQVAAACVVAITQNLLTRQTCIKLLNAIAGRLGVEIDAEAELTAVDAEAVKRAQNDVFTTPNADGNPAPAAAAQP